MTCFLFKLFLIKAATRYVLWKRLFLEIPQYSPENNLKPATLLNMQLATLLKTDSNTGVFKEHQGKAASVLNVIHYVTVQAFPQKRKSIMVFTESINSCTDFFSKCYTFSLPFVMILNILHFPTHFSWINAYLHPGIYKQTTSAFNPTGKNFQMWVNFRIFGQ